MFDLLGKATLITGEQTYSGAELQHKVDQCTRMLLALDIKRLGIYLDNGAEWIAFDLAAQQANITCIPMPKFFSRQQLEHCSTLAGIDAIVTDEPTYVKQMLPCFVPTSFTLDRAVLLTNNILPKQQAMSSFDTISGKPEIIHKITFTSGTTGNPKGVQLTKSAMQNVVSALAKALGHVNMERHLCLMPFPILLENIAGVYLPLTLGATVIAPSTQALGIFGSNGFDAHRLAKAIEHYRPGSMILLPQLLLALTLLAEQKKIPTDSFRFLAVGGGTVSSKLITRAHEAGLPVYEGYGLSECSSVVALNTPDQYRVGSVGKVLDHQHVSIEKNEVIVQGSGFSGYLESNPADIAQKNIPSNLKIYTGDEGYLDNEGFLYINGRKKNVIVSSFGRNIHPEWPESCLLESEYIQQAIVVGEGRPFLSAIIVAKPDCLNDIQAHVDKVNAGLPDYARIGQWLWFSPLVFNSKHLLTSNGRIKRGEVETCFHEELDQLYSNALVMNAPDVTMTRKIWQEKTG